MNNTKILIGWVLAVVIGYFLGGSFIDSRVSTLETLNQAYKEERALLVEQNKMLTEEIIETKTASTIIQTDPFPTRPNCVMPDEISYEQAANPYFLQELKDCNALLKQYDKDKTGWYSRNGQ